MPLSEIICQLLGDLFEAWVLLELLILCAIPYLSEPQDLGNGPFLKRDPSPPNLARHVFSLAQVSVKLLYQHPSSWFHVLAHYLPASSFYFLLKWGDELFEASLFNIPLLGEMLPKSLFSLVGVKGPDFSFFHHNLYLLKHDLEGSFLVPFLYIFSQNFFYHISYHFIKGWRARVRHFGFREIWRRLGLESLRDLI